MAKEEKQRHKLASYGNNQTWRKMKKSYQANKSFDTEFLLQYAAEITKPHKLLVNTFQLRPEYALIATKWKRNKFHDTYIISDTRDCKVLSIFYSKGCQLPYRRLLQKFSDSYRIYFPILSY